MPNPLPVSISATMVPKTRLSVPAFLLAADFVSMDLKTDAATAVVNRLGTYNSSTNRAKQSHRVQRSPATAWLKVFGIVGPAPALPLRWP